MLRAKELENVLPATGARLAVMGCGTSLYMAQAFATLREQLGQGQTDAFAASEFPVARTYDAVLAISRSGTTTEVIRTLDALPSGTKTTAICAVEGSPVGAAVDAEIVLEFADEVSVVQTLFATSALALLRAHLGESLEPVIAQAEEVVQAALPADPAPFDRFTFVGRGWAVGLAYEAALKVREAAQAWAEAYPALEYRHGPIAVADERTLVWAIGPVGDEKLLDDIRSVGATVVDPPWDPMVSLVLAQRFAVALAESRGLDPDHPRNLTRSVVL